ncbi:MAG: O-antigen ligase family protein [Candidatus Doudnabacteria bacterium]|nr:O-antigen ligase family protein [Candidatus Doudnabacteria bacterium]
MVFKLALFSMLLLEGVSLLAFVWPVLALPLLMVVAAAVFVLAWRRPEFGIYLLFGELFIGSRGHLLEYKFLSLRVVVFMAVFLAWASNVILSIAKNLKAENRFFGLWPQNDGLGWKYSILLIAIGWGIANGALRGNSLSNIFYDANGYLYLLILPAVISVIKSREQIEKLLQILAAAIIVIALKTLTLFLWFTFGWPGVATLYHWVMARDIGEITGEVGSASRIFMQSQFWALMGIFIFIPFTLPSPLPSREGNQENNSSPLVGEVRWGVIIAAIFSVIFSLSRSFWLGGTAGAVFLVAMLLFYFRERFMKVLRLSAMLIFIALVAVGFLSAVGALAGASVTVASRSGNPAAEAAGGARLLLLPELLAEIREAPIFGKGFGELVSYKSYLPDRVRPDNPDGTITAYAFEWGYLDTALKVGALGLIIYLLFVGHIFAKGWKAVQIQNSKFKMQNLGVLSGLVALLVLNITTPYLNHPLGIGYLLFAILNFKNFEF